MNIVCIICTEYRIDQIGHEINGSVVCDDCYDNYLNDLYEARAKWQAEFEQEYLPKIYAERAAERDAMREQSWYDEY